MQTGGHVITNKNMNSSVYNWKYVDKNKEINSAI